MLSVPADPNASQEVQVVDAVLHPAPMASPATDFHRRELLWDPLSDLSWSGQDEVNWEREIVLELRRVTAHLQKL